MQAFLQIVNDRRVVFPHAYVQKSSRQAVLLLPVTFDVQFCAAHAEVHKVAVDIAEQLVADARSVNDVHPQFLGNTNILVLPKEDLLYEIKAASIPAETVLQQRVIQGAVQYRRDPKNSIEQAARTALWTIRDAVEHLVRAGGYRRLCRCGWDECRRVLFVRSDVRQYCSDRCRQAARRARS